MKTVIISFLCFLCSFSMGMEKGERTIFGEIVGVEDIKSTKVKVKLDLGIYSKQLYTDSTGNYMTIENERLKFGSMVDAMNYMNEQGWCFVQAYVIHKERHSIVKWIISKKIESPKDVHEGFKIKETPKQQP